MKFPDGHGPVLVVDDDEDIRESIGQVLEDLEYEILMAGNGREALRVARTATPAPGLILLDLTMPVMNGWQFLEERQKDAALARIPVIVMTAGMGAQVPAADASRVLRKPLSYEDLVEVLGRWIDEAGDRAFRS